MHRAHGVQVLWAGRALENGLAIVHLHDQEVQRLGNGRVGQFAPQHGLHLLQAIEVGDLLAGGDARARACVQRGEDVALLRQPVFKVVVLGHGVSGWWVGLKLINCICNYCSYN